MRRDMLVLMLGVTGAFSADALAAQEQREGGFEVTPYVALFKDSYDIGANGNTGVLAGVRLGYGVKDRLRIVGNLGYGEAGDVASNPAGAADYLVYKNQWLMTTAGAEYDVLEGPITVGLGLQAGAGWRQVSATGTVGSPGDDAYGGGDGYSFYDVLVPSVAVRRRITGRTTLELGLSDYVFDVLEGPVDHSPAFSVGMVIR